MRRRPGSRFLLFLLILLTVALIVRLVVGSGGIRGEVTLDDVDHLHILDQTAFEVEQPVRVVVHAVGSVDPTDTSGQAMAAYAWILRLQDRKVVWVQKPNLPPNDRHTLTQSTDSLNLESGRYLLYFTSFGNRSTNSFSDNLLRRVADPAQKWKADESKWRVSIQRIKGEPGKISRIDLSTDELRLPGTIWTTLGDRQPERDGYVFEVKAPVNLRLYAISEIEGTEVRDEAYIEDVAAGSRVWELTAAETRPAGGAGINRMFDGNLRLEPGIYRAVFARNEHHHPDHWLVNPPFDPSAWGLTIVAPDSSIAGRVVDFDPWRVRTPIVGIQKASTGILWKAQFTLTDTMNLVISGMGELTDSGQYDYAWLERNSTGERVWEMTRERSRNAGGDDKNRVQTDFLDLEPGTYTLAYQTDDTHAFGDFNSDEPLNPERWGVSLFSLSPRPPEGVLTIISQETTSNQDGNGGVPGPPPPPPAMIEGEVVIEATRIENNADVTEFFEMKENGEINIYAVGEINNNGRYDYGWIERANNHEIVWEMNFQNTEPAGGDERYRRFKGRVVLTEGKYLIRFKTDAAHAYNDFGPGGPPDAERYGITISR